MNYFASGRDYRYLQIVRSCPPCLYGKDTVRISCTLGLRDVLFLWVLGGLVWALQLQLLNCTLTALYNVEHNVEHIIISSCVSLAQESRSAKLVVSLTVV